MRSRLRSKTSPQQKKKELHIYSDFDNTLVPMNTAAVLLRHYLFSNPHNEPLHRRLSRAGGVVSSYARTKALSGYYACLRRIPARERQHVLATIPVSRRWLQVVKDLRLKHRSKTVHVTIVSRNCVDVVHDWLMQNRDELRKQHISVVGIVANGPLHDTDISFVRERSGVRHLDYVGLGQMELERKRAFLPTNAIYLGDQHEGSLAPFVKEYIRL